MIFKHYFYIWSIFIPISSVVFVPEIKGSLPSYFFAFLSFFFVALFSPKNREKYYRDIVIFIVIFIVITLVSQLGNLIHGINFYNILLLNQDDHTEAFRSTLLSQFMYLFVGFITYLYFKYFYCKEFDKYIYYSGLVLVLYGIYEVCYFALFNQNGDFLSNRLFGDMTVNNGSLFQVMNLGGFQILRMKSLTGEPSMFALTILPYWIFSIHKRKSIFQVIFFLALILSTSTTAFLGIVIYLLYRWFCLGFRDPYIVKVIILMILVAAVFWNIITDWYTNMLVAKLMGENISGLERSSTIINHLYYFLDLQFIHQLFGIGFGYIRSYDLFTTLLINTGIVGFIIYSILFLYPLWKLTSSYYHMGIKAVLIVTYIVMMVSVAEFSYLIVWLFLGIAYKEMQKIPT